MRTTFLLILTLFLTIVAQADPADGLNKFGYRYFHQLPAEGNIVCSPLSIHSCFAMVALGTGGATRTESFRVLGIDDTRNYNLYMDSLAPNLGKLTVANSLWPSEGFQLLSSYVSAARRDFNAKPTNLNYSSAENARKTINQWVDKMTAGKIDELLKKGDVDSSTAMVLTNAVYFRGSWNHPFPQGATKPGKFTTPDGVVEVPMMNGAIRAGYHSDDNFQIVSLPYAKSRLAFAVILPKDETKRKSLKRRINAGLLNQPGLKEGGGFRSGFEKVMVTMPKFSVRQRSEPIEDLRKMGMTELLGGKPDFSKMTKTAGLIISNCFHEAVVEVDEQGTVAAAATAVVMTRSASRPRNQIVVDHPFFFVLYDTRTFAPLFIGQVTHPE